MLKVNLQYCINGFDLIEERIESFSSLKIRLHEIKNDAAVFIKGIFSVDIVIQDIGRISIGLDEKCILSYTSADFEEVLTSLGDKSAQGYTMYYFGDCSLMSNKYIIQYKDALNVLEVWIREGSLSDNIKWTKELY